MFHWRSGGWGVGEWFAMSTMMILFSGTLVVLAIWLVRAMRGDSGSGAGSRADVLLAERFARGEIDGEEFARARELLHSRGAFQTNSGR